MNGLNFNDNFVNHDCIDYFAGCPKLKSLTLDSFLYFEGIYDDSCGNSGIDITRESLEHLSDGCEELKDLKITNAFLGGFDCESEVKELFPNCNVELKKCGDDVNGYFHNGKAFDGFFWSHLRSLDNLDGGEIDLMFTQNYGEDI